MREKRHHVRVLEGEMRSVCSADSWLRLDVVKGIEHQVGTSEPHCEPVLAHRPNETTRKVRMSLVSWERCGRERTTDAGPGIVTLHRQVGLSIACIEARIPSLPEALIGSK